MSFGRLMDAALASREVAAEYFVIWSAALLVMPPLFYTVQRASAYPWIRRRSLDLLQQVALTDRLFFVVWSMLAAMLIASVLWDALFPDQTDQQILGVLPVRSRTVACRAGWRRRCRWVGVHARHRSADGGPLRRGRCSASVDRIDSWRIRRPPSGDRARGHVRVLRVAAGARPPGGDAWRGRGAQGGGADAARNRAPPCRVVHVPARHGPRPGSGVAPGRWHQLAAGVVHRRLHGDGGPPYSFRPVGRQIGIRVRRSRASARRRGIPDPGTVERAPRH